MTLPTDPFAHFALWYQEAESRVDVHEADAVNLATVSPEGRPSNRMVLLKDYDARGFVFYTNLQSRKGQHLTANPHAALCFYWEAMSRQVRIEGAVEPVSTQEADAYFATRPLKSRIGAWASQQSQPLDSHKTLLAEVAKQGVRFATGSVPRPDFWSGFRLIPDRMEFWTRGEYRVHERVCFEKNETGEWNSGYLYP